MTSWLEMRTSSVLISITLLRERKPEDHTYLPGLSTGCNDPKDRFLILKPHLHAAYVNLSKLFCRGRRAL